MQKAKAWPVLGGTLVKVLTGCIVSHCVDRSGGSLGQACQQTMCILVALGAQVGLHMLIQGIWCPGLEFLQDGTRSQQACRVSCTAAGGNWEPDPACTVSES